MNLKKRRSNEDLNKYLSSTPIYILSWKTLSKPVSGKIQEMFHCCKAVLGHTGKSMLENKIQPLYLSSLNGEKTTQPFTEKKE